MKVSVALFIIAIVLPVLSFAHQGGERPSKSGIFESERNTFPHFIHQQGKDKPANKSKSSIIFYEGFENTTMDGALPAGWEIKRTFSLDEIPVADAQWPHWFLNSANYYGFSNPAPYIFNGDGSLAIGYNAPGFTWAITPEIVIPDNEENINLSYWAWYLNGFYEGDIYYSNYYVRVFVDGQWQNLLTFIGNDHNTNLFSTPIVQSLNEFKGKSIRLAFVYEDTFGWQMAIDEIFVREEIAPDFGVRNLEITPLFGILPGDEVAITVSAYLNSMATGSASVSLMINGVEHELKTTSELTFLGMEQRVRFYWQPEHFGDYTIEIRLAHDEILNNNSVSQNVYVYHYHNAAEDFENIVPDGLGFPYILFPPPGWVISSNDWVDYTTEFQISEKVSATMVGRDQMPESFMITHPIHFNEEDKWLRFYVKGLNNHININSSQYPSANPPGVQGYSSIQVRYAEHPDGPWTELGHPVQFANVYDFAGNLIQSANGTRSVELDISHLSGIYHLGFFHTSSFQLNISGTDFYSYAIVDNIMVGNSPSRFNFRVLSPNGQGIENAVVHIVDNEGKTIRSLISGDLGLVSTELLEGEYTIAIHHLGYETFLGSLAINQPLFQTTYTLQPAVEVFDVVFEVLTPEANPAPYTLVTISNFTGKTDDNGLITVSGLAAGNHKFSAYLSGYITFMGEVQGNSETVHQIVTLQLPGTAVGSEWFQPKIVLFPNPANHLTTIKSDVIMHSIQIIDLSGRVVREDVANSYSLILNLAGMENGLYIVNVITAHGRKATKLQVISQQ